MNQKIKQFKYFIRQPYVFPGRYPLFAIVSDGGCICKTCAGENARLIIQATRDGEHYSGWCIEGIDVNWEDQNLICDNCGSAIESAYGAD
jgi:hypothetical protein